MTPEPRLERHLWGDHDLMVVRDDLLPGGTKVRALGALCDQLGAATEIVYAGPVFGYAQVALAHGAPTIGRRATLFVAKRKSPHERTKAAHYAGAKVIEVAPGYLSNVEAKARAYCELFGATLLPFGLEHPATLEAIALDARRIDYEPAEVWCVAGSGMLTRALQQAWPRAAHHAVRIGTRGRCETGSATTYDAPERFEQDAAEPPPWPSCSNYDAKLWRFAREHASPGALIWNVAP